MCLQIPIISTLSPVTCLVTLTLVVYFNFWGVFTRLTSLYISLKVDAGECWLKVSLENGRTAPDFSPAREAFYRKGDELNIHGQISEVFKYFFNIPENDVKEVHCQVRLLSLAIVLYNFCYISLWNTKDQCFLIDVIGQFTWSMDS